MVLWYQVDFPAGDRISSCMRPLAIMFGLYPSRYSRKIRRTSAASSGMITSVLPSSPFSSPRNCAVFSRPFPCWKMYWMPIRTFLEMDSDSCWANELMIVISTSPLASMVLMFSFSKSTGMPRSFSFRIFFRESMVFLAHRLMDFVITMLIFPASQSAIIRLNCSRCLVDVPLMPSSA